MVNTRSSESCLAYTDLDFKLTKLFKSIVRQRNTLDRFLVTLHVFDEILGICQPFAPYLGCLQAFGQRDSDDEKFRSGYRWRRNVALQQDGMICQRLHRLQD